MNGTPTGPVVSIPVEKGRKIPEGYTLFKTSGNAHRLLVQRSKVLTVRTTNMSMVILSISSNGYDKYYGIKNTPLKCIPFATVYKAQIRTAVCLILAAIILSLIPASIIYNIQKRKFDIFEYRRKMTDAMAHDLKSPMAAISAFAENLSDNVATDKREYYAGKIEEKVAQMNKMVNDILEFSKSENLACSDKQSQCGYRRCHREGHCRQ